MKYFLILFIFLVGCAGSPIKPRECREIEYRIEIAVDESHNIFLDHWNLKQFGADGWEFCGTLIESSTHQYDPKDPVTYFIFKRSKTK